jgi:glycerol-3-phosphate dehydrogenase
VRREPAALADGVWDVVVVGGGIHGACVAWDAVLRGLTVCLVEQDDFGSATSSNTMKIVHGGLRYLQHGDVRRMRESIRERRTLLRIAPHLVQPLPVLVPTYGHGWRGREALSVALALNDLVGFDRNAGLADAQRVPPGRTMSRAEWRRLVPDLETPDMTGAALFYDAQVYNSERLLLAFLRSAAKAGAVLANYLPVTGFLLGPDGVEGVRATDRLTGERVAIRARTVVNAAGPWVERVLGLASPAPGLGASFAKALNVVTRRRLSPYAVGFPARSGYRDRDSLVVRGTRLLFVVPWRDVSLVGTWYAPHQGAPGGSVVTEADVACFVREVNASCPALGLTLDTVDFVHGGLVPMSGTDPVTGDPRLAKQGRVVDHAPEGLPGLFSIVGVKYTTARLVAERVVDRLFLHLRRPAPPSLSARVPLHGADRAGPAGTACLELTGGLDREGLARLVRTHGGAHGEVLAHLDRGAAADPLAVVRAETRHAVRCEMAQTLGDVVFRRTEIGTAGDPGLDVLGACARTAAVELGWNADRLQEEVHDVRARFGLPR